VADINAYRLEMAHKAGADFVVQADEDVPAYLMKNCGRLADRVVISTGALSAAEAALQSVDRGGTVLFLPWPGRGKLLPWISTPSGATISASRPATELHRGITDRRLNC